MTGIGIKSLTVNSILHRPSRKNHLQEKKQKSEKIIYLVYDET